MTQRDINEFDQARGRRAEEIAEWYFRLNGFLLIPGFIVHPDRRRRRPKTEADLLGVRLKYSAEGFFKNSHGGDRSRPGSFEAMKDHDLLVKPGNDGTVSKHQIAMVEVKASLASINGPWTDRAENNMSRALQRVGFGNRDEIDRASQEMYDKLRYVGPSFIVQYYSVCSVKSPELSQQYSSLVQVTFDEIADFLHDRFKKFPQKIPEDSDLILWEGFGCEFMRWFERMGWHANGGASNVQCRAAVKRYIQFGECS